MEFRLVDPDLPTVSRWLSLNSRYGRQSTLRMLQYEHLEKQSVEGKVLDFGGGNKSKYRDLLPNDIDYSSVNIDPNIEPTWLIEPGAKIPAKANSFDVCVCLNTLEHICDPLFVLGEIHRTLKPGGVVHIAVPWMFRIHGHPDDYNRLTPSWWRQAMEETGFSETSVTPLVWGRYSTAAGITGYKGLVRLQRTLTHMKDVLYASFAFRNADGVYCGKRGQRICNVALGHFITARK